MGVAEPGEGRVDVNEEDGRTGRRGARREMDRIVEGIGGL